MKDALRQKAVALLVLAGLCAYCNSISKTFVLDDMGWITDTMNEPWKYLRETINRPLIALSLLLNYKLAGFNVIGFHWLNLAVHLLAALTLFGIVGRTLLLERWRGRFARSATWLAMTVALWWEVHPLTTQAVTYIIQRCESMMGLFYLLSLYCVIRGHASPRRRRWYAAAVAAGLCSASAKEVSATIPLVVLVYDWMFLAVSLPELVRRRWGLYAGLTLIWVANASFWSLGLKSEESGAGFGIHGITPWQYLLTQTHVVPYYLRLCVWPWPLCFMYRGWPIVGSLREAALPGSFIVVLLLLSAWAVVRKWWPGFLGAWFFFILAPTSSFVPILDVAFEHRLYLPLIAVIALIVFSGHALVEHLASQRRAAAIQAMLAGVVAVALGVLTFHRNQDYSSEETIWRDTVRRLPCYFAKSALGCALNRPETADEARLWLQQAIDEQADAVSWINLGAIMQQKGDLNGAEHSYVQAVELAPRDPLANGNLGWLLYRQGKLEEAAEKLKTTIDLAPTNASDRGHLAVVLDALGQHEAAQDEYRRIRELDPSFAEGVNRSAREILLGKDVNNEAKRKEALEMCSQAKRTGGDKRADMLDTLAMAQAANGRFDDAIATAKKGIDLAMQSNNATWLAALREHLAFYEKHQPFNYATAHPKQ